MTQAAFFYQSNPSHCSKLVSDFHKKNIKTLDWLGNSPDINQIENLWAILKDKLADKHPKLLKTWNECIWTQKITAEYFKHLVYIMPCRLQAVIKNKGGHKKHEILTQKLVNATQFYVDKLTF